MGKNELSKPASACHSCRSCGIFLKQLGLDLKKWDYLVALAGNPNTGKSTIFNALTGLRQHTGNWPGKTVSRAEGGFHHDDKRFKLVDLPGTYSLLSISTDEEIAREFILFGGSDCMVVVVDATCMERNLNLVLQILEITDKVVVALNLMDEAKRKGIEIDHHTLASDLGVPVVPVIASRGEGFNRLLRAIADVAYETTVTKPQRIQIDGKLQSAIEELVPLIKKTFPGLPNARWVAMRLLDGDSKMREALFNGKLETLSNIKLDLSNDLGIDLENSL